MAWICPGWHESRVTAAAQPLELGWRPWLATWSGQSELAHSAPGNRSSCRVSRATAEDAKRTHGMDRYARASRSGPRQRASWMRAACCNVELDARRELARGIQQGLRRVRLPAGSIGVRGLPDDRSPHRATLTRSSLRACWAPALREVAAAKRPPRRTLRRLGRRNRNVAARPSRECRARRAAGGCPSLRSGFGAAERRVKGVQAGLEHERFNRDNDRHSPGLGGARRSACGAPRMPAPGVAFGGDPYLHGLWRVSGSNARSIRRQLR